MVFKLLITNFFALLSWDLITICKQILCTRVTKISRCKEIYLDNNDKTNELKIGVCMQVSWLLENKRNE